MTTFIVHCQLMAKVIYIWMTINPMYITIVIKVNWKNCHLKIIHETRTKWSRIEPIRTLHKTMMKRKHANIKIIYSENYSSLQYLWTSVLIMMFRFVCTSTKLSSDLCLRVYQIKFRFISLNKAKQDMGEEQFIDHFFCLVRTIKYIDVLYDR